MNGGWVLIGSFTAYAVILRAIDKEIASEAKELAHV